MILEIVKNGRLSSPLRTTNHVFNEQERLQQVKSPLRPLITTTNTNGTTAIELSREVSKEREKGPLDYTDLEGNEKLPIEKQI